MIAQSPSTVEHLMRQVADNVTGISRHVERLQLLQTTERLADYLLDAVNDDQTSMALTLPCDKRLIATYLGMERKIFSRALAKLRSVGVITKRFHIQITDTLVLKELRYQPT
jgi:CRP/FNR family transcriptional activator FtrB